MGNITIYDNKTKHKINKVYAYTNGKRKRVAQISRSINGKVECFYEGFTTYEKNINELKTYLGQGIGVPQRDNNGTNYSNIIKFGLNYWDGIYTPKTAVRNESTQIKWNSPLTTFVWNPDIQQDGVESKVYICDVELESTISSATRGLIWGLYEDFPIPLQPNQKNPKTFTTLNDITIPIGTNTFQLLSTNQHRESDKTYARAFENGFHNIRSVLDSFGTVLMGQNNLSFAKNIKYFEIGMEVTPDMVSESERVLENRLLMVKPLGNIPLEGFEFEVKYRCSDKPFFNNPDPWEYGNLNEPHRLISAGTPADGYSSQVSLKVTRTTSQEDIWIEKLQLDVLTE